MGRTLVANRLLAGSACGKRHRVRPLNSVVRCHVSSIAKTAISAIDWYQQRVSPRKGFSCAYRVKWGGESCSGAVKAAFASGVLLGLGALIRQPAKCYAAAQALAEDASQASGKDNEELDTPTFCAQWAAMEGAWWCCFMPFIGT